MSGKKPYGDHSGNILDQKKQQANDQQALVDELYKSIGQRKVENDFLKNFYFHSDCQLLSWFDSGIADINSP